MDRIRWALTGAGGLAMRWSGTEARFSKDWRWGIRWYHRAVYGQICTFGSNIIADGGDWPYIP